MLDTSSHGQLNAVRVMSSARLHMGFFDMHGGLGRRFGSIGLSIQSPQLQVSVRRAEQWQAQGEDSQRAMQIAQTLMANTPHSNANQVAEIQVEQAIPAHAGLGSGTQLALAIGAALNRLFNLKLSLAQIAQLTQRATRSGIGLGTFELGGLIVDGGRADGTLVPPVISRMHFPDWPILLISQPGFLGVHGQTETQAFQALPPFSESVAQTLCREVLMRAMPALQEKNLEQFGLAIQQLQAACGDYFAPAQGGHRYASPQMREALTMLQQQGVVCFGQSSWGPTGFAILPDMNTAQRLQTLGQQQFAGSDLQWSITQADNQPAQMIEIGV
jgi:beta-ribofuranosylaminobenzene 5'-phosphate synthase